MFKSKEHQQFYVEMIRECGINDTYHQAFFYVMGLSEETRTNINQLFYFGANRIDLCGLDEGWQTSSTMRVCLLAFNLWNGFGEKYENFSPNHLFCCEFAPYFMEAIKLRYPERFKDLNMERKWSENER